MRAFMIIAFVAMLFLSAWANNADTAGASQIGAPNNSVETQPGY
ncbi:MAG TPA: hypothetical protein VGC38_09200 [Pseudolabrys sp.]